MGNCLSDVKGGQQAVGGGAQGGFGGRGGSTGTAVAAAGPNDAVDHFFRARGEHALFTPIEVH